jgi:hypothetical protein
VVELLQADKAQECLGIESHKRGSQLFFQFRPTLSGYISALSMQFAALRHLEKAFQR